MRDRTRPVETPGDVRSILDSGFYSFAELLDCVRVARTANAWDLVEAAGTALLRCSVGRPRKPLPSLRDAAQAIVAAYLARATDLQDVEGQAAAAAAALSDLSTDDAMGDSALRAVGESSKWLDELRVLYADATEPSLIALCARLRDIDRADLGRDAATRALELEARGEPSPRTRSAALTTRAAALLDLGDPPRALTDIRKAAELRPEDPYVLNAYARVLTACGQPDQAVDVAKESFRLEPGRHAAHALLAAAAAAADEDTLAAVKEYLNAHPDPEEQETTSVWVETLAAEALIAAGQIERAASAVAMLRRDGRAPQGKVNVLERRLKAARQDQQGRLL